MFHVSCFMTLIGPRGYGYEQIKKEIEASPYKNDIQELGWLDLETMTEYLKNAGVFVFPSLYEGFGMPLLESFAAGAPVVASDIPALREVGADVPLYANPDDPKSIANAAYTLLTDDALHTRKIAEGFRHAEKYSWREAAKRTLDIFSSA